MRIVWDEAKRLLNIETHGLNFQDAADRFRFEDALIEASSPGVGGRSRYIAVGVLDGRVVTFVFSPLGSEAISLISFRPASRKERARYEEG